MTENVEVQHTDMVTGRALLEKLKFEDLSIPSVVAVLDTRWKAEFKGKFMTTTPENQQFLAEVLSVVKGLRDVTTQRAVYYALRGAHPEWTYKGEPLGDAFYEHLVMWIMEKAQLMTGYTMQSIGIWAAPRGYIAGDGQISTPRRPNMKLSSQPALGFDMADAGMSLATNARKVIHFEKDAGLSAIISDNFPKYVEAIFSTSQGQLTEAATKFMRQAEDLGLDLYAIHDGDPSGVQMQLMHGAASKNNCYMPTEFYPRWVKPLGFYPSVGLLLDLPPEAVTDTEDKIFNNLIQLCNERQKMVPQLRRYRLGGDVNVLVQQRKKWEFQALNAIHESAPKIYILEGLRVHKDEIKHVPDGDSIKEAVVQTAKLNAEKEVESKLQALAQQLYDTTIKKSLVETLRTALGPKIQEFDDRVDELIQQLMENDSENFREQVKWEIYHSPELYSIQVIRKMGNSILNAGFHPSAGLKATLEVTTINASMNVTASIPPARFPLTKTDLVTAIEERIIKNQRTRVEVVSKLRAALEERFGEADETW